MADGLLHRFEWKAQIAPAAVTAFERRDTADSNPVKLERHTGAGGFVRSSAVEHNVAIAREFKCFVHRARVPPLFLELSDTILDAAIAEWARNERSGLCHHEAR